jgi:Holliday junction resolvasome RuvABC endonuclease subunit
LRNVQTHNVTGLEGKFLGIDASLTSTGIALLDDNWLTTWREKPKTMGSLRLDHYDRVMTGLLSRECRPDVVCLEGYAYGRSNKAHAIGELGGLIRLHLWRSGIPYCIVPPPTLKKFVTGKGSGPKQPMSLHLFKRWGVSVEEEDEADAAGLAFMVMYGCHGLPKTKAQAEALAVVTMQQGPSPIRARTRN